MNRPYFITSICFIVLFLACEHNSPAQDLCQSGVMKYYKVHRWDLYDRAKDIWVKGAVHGDDEKEISITKDVYSFKNKEIERSLFDSLQVFFPTKDFSACFIEYKDDEGFFMFVSDEYYKEPLPKVDSDRLLKRNLFGIICNKHNTIYLYGDCPYLITSKGHQISKSFETGTTIFNYSKYVGVYVFFIKKDSIQLVDFIIDE